MGQLQSDYIWQAIFFLSKYTISQNTRDDLD